MRKDENSKRRINGLEKPWHPLQIATWFILPLLICYFYLFLIPLLENYVFMVVASVIFGAATIFAAVSGYRVCAIDPVDICVLQTQDTPRDKVFCYLCSTYVQKESRHCILCKKCVDTFDHHCKWLNTCVGKHNYRPFLGVVVSVTILTTLTFAINIILLVRHFTNKDGFTSQVNSSDMIAVDSFASMVILFVAGSLLLPLVALVWQLMCFHIMLAAKGLTTYEFIMGQHKKQQERLRQRRSHTSHTPSRQSESAVEMKRMPSASASATASPSTDAGAKPEAVSPRASGTQGDVVAAMPDATADV